MPKAQAAKSGANLGVYPSYMVKPQWHSAVVEELQKKGNSETLQVYNGLFQDLPKASKSMQLKLHRIGKDVAKRAVVRELKPVHVDPVHLEKYRAEATNPLNKNAFFMTHSSEVRDQGAYFQELTESAVELADTRPMQITCKTLNPRESYRRLTLEGEVTPVQTKKKHKTVADFEQTLKRIKHEKELIVKYFYPRLCRKKKRRGHSLKEPWA